MEARLDALHAPSVPAAARWSGRSLTGLASLFLLFDGATKVIGHPAVTEAMARLGLPGALSPGIGFTLLGCLALYLAPRTAPLGAVLLTGYLGGAVLAHLRVADPLFTHTLFPVYLGCLIWAGLFLRDGRVRRLLAAP